MMARNLRRWNGPISRCRGRLSAGGIAATVTGLALAGCTAASSPTVSSATPGKASSAGSSYNPGAAKNTRVRLATVTTIQSGGLLDQLVADFQEKTGVTVEVYAGDDPYTQARAGKADLVFSHLGHRDAKAFLQDGLGQWPQAVLSNTIGYIIPPGDPANVASATDPIQAFERIAKTKSPFVLNNNEGLKYLTDTLWNAAGAPDKTGWYIDSGLQDAPAMDAAAKANAYSLWGVTPFLQYQQQTHSTLQPLVINDSLMQRLMVSVAVDPAKVAGVNAEGAKAFQAYLLDPVTQAKIRAFRVPGVSQPLFWPQGRTNASAILPGATPGPGKTPGTGRASSTAPTVTP
jgi:tungstate transport system substrate-binding protein